MKGSYVERRMKEDREQDGKGQEHGGKEMNPQHAWLELEPSNARTLNP
jgi:hypothetical protein